MSTSEATNLARRVVADLAGADDAIKRIGVALSRAVRSKRDLWPWAAAFREAMMLSWREDGE